jgi:hypothetical protein
VIALVVGAVVLLAAVAVALVVFLGGDDDPSAATRTTADRSTSSAPESSDETTSSSRSSSSSSAESSAPEELPPATVAPDGLGEDPVFDQLAVECYDGDMASCDALYDSAQDVPGNEAYAEYADSCAGRQETGTLQYCTNTFPDF